MDYSYLKQKKILLVDDEEEILTMVTGFLREDGYTQIRTASTVADALSVWRQWEPELAVLDVMLPDGDGFSLFQQVRTWAESPVLFLTARGEDEDRIRGLGLGADDYLVKPFLPKEPLVQLAGSRIDFSRAEVVKEGRRFPLTAKEHEILQTLCRNAGRIVTIDQLCQAVWGENPFGYENSLMAHIRRIRAKIERNPSKPVSLLTVKGLGYKLVLEGK